jgi:hypothetical protein
MRFFYTITLAVLILSSCSQNEKTLFNIVDSNQSGVHFNNRIQHEDTLSVIDFEYMYNGAGVAAGDFNNDGLQDLFFTGNMVSCKLYLNIGNLKFEDITEKAGVGTKTWANGVALLDINQDGFTDIYVSVGGHRFTPESERNNLLFINNGDLTFKESAAEYGLDDRGYNVQSAFLDYDKDGDLDVYLLRNSFVNYSRNMSRPKMTNGEAYSTDKLLRNNGNSTFTDVSREAGILIEGFGLGINICDINRDGWQDIYVSNDFLSNDLIWINNQNGTFTNQAGKMLKHQTFNGMGNDVADYNNDGLVDIVVLDMLPEDNKRWKLTPRGNNYDEFEKGLRLGYDPQYIRNTLQLNNGNGTFSDISQVAGMEATEWSWSALFADLDNDGLKDLFISNGYGKDITNQDFIVYGEEGQTMGLPAATKKERQDLLNKIPGVKLSNYVYRNKGDLTFADETKKWGFQRETYSNGAAYADLDLDGDLDLIINNIDDEALIMENTLIQENSSNGNYLRIKFKGPKGNIEGFGAQVTLYQQQSIQYQYFAPWRGYLSTVEPLIHFGLNGTAIVDSLVIVWPDGKQQTLKQVKSNQVITADYQESKISNEKNPVIKPSILSSVTDSGIDFKHKENEFIDFKIQPALPHMHSRNGPGIGSGDINGDGLTDIIIGGASGQGSKTYIQQKNGNFVSQNPGLDSLNETMGLLLFDADNDQDNDLYITSGGSEHGKVSELYQDKLYINDGTGNFSDQTSALPKEMVSGSCVVGADYDHDGDVDLFIGGRVKPGEYPLNPSSFLLRNDQKNGNPKFTNVSALEVDSGLDQVGMICAALWTDVNNDGWHDLLIAGEFTPIRILINEQGKFKSPKEIKNSSGWWNSLTAGDFDSDGDTDYIAGNLGLNSHFHASEKEPLCIHAKDFNMDGRIDPIMSYYVQGESYVGHPRDILVDQINSMRARFRSFKVYSEVTFEESFLPEELEDAFVVCADRFENAYLENTGKGNFNIKALPIPAQTAPVYGVVSGDFTGDGNLDFIAIGNAYSPEVISGRDDASIGWLMAGDGKGNFNSIHNMESGFFADGDGKGLAMVTTTSGPRLIATNNNGPVGVYKFNQQSVIFKPETNDSYAIVTLQDGRNYKSEFYYGSSYLSQSDRSLLLPASAVSIKVFNLEGKSKVIQLRNR